MFNRALVAVPILACAAAVDAQDESFRFFFDVSGAGEEEPYSGTLSFTNPTVVNSGTLYLWVEFGTPDQEFHGINLVVDITGPAEFTSGAIYDHHMVPPDFDRWQVIPRPTWNPADPGNSPQRWVLGSIFRVGGAGAGFFNRPRMGITDTHFTQQNSFGPDQWGSTLGATMSFQFTGNPGEVAEIRLQNGTSGNGGVTFTPSDFVYFGFGDGPVPNKKGQLAGGEGGPTPIADAFVVPEPGTALLLAMVLVMRRRLIRL